MANRYSSYSALSTSGHSRSATAPTGSQPVSTTSLLNQLHTAFSARQRHQLESNTSLVVNTWASGNTIDQDLGARAWEHARRRAEDGCILLASLHHSTPSLFVPFCESLPLSIPSTFYTALNALRPFLHRVTAHNASMPSHSSFAAVFHLSTEGELQGATLSLSTSGVDTKSGLLDLGSDAGNRAFDVFYYLLTSATPKEREFLGLKNADQYTLLSKSRTYTPPDYIPTADDAAAAEDWRDSLRAIGIKGDEFRNMLSVLASILRLGDAVSFLVDAEELQAACEEVSGMLELDPQILVKNCSTEEREILVAALYEALLDWVLAKANDAIRTDLHHGHALGSSTGSEVGIITPHSGNGGAADNDAMSASLTVLEIPSPELSRAISLRTIFDDANGINAEMKDDEVPFVPAGSSTLHEMRDAIANHEADLGIMSGPLGRARDSWLDQRQKALEKVGVEADSDTFLWKILYPVPSDGIVLGRNGRFKLSNVVESNRVWFHLSLHPTDHPPASTNTPQNAGNSHSNIWSAGTVSAQLRTWRLAEWSNFRQRKVDFTADFDVDEFVERYVRLGCQAGREGVEAWILERGWSNGEIIVGRERVWMRDSAWWEAETGLDLLPLVGEQSEIPMNPIALPPGDIESAFTSLGPAEGGSFEPHYGVAESTSRDHLLPLHTTPAVPQTVRNVDPGDYGLGHRGDDKRRDVTYEGEIDPELADGKKIEIQEVSFGRRAWIALAWLVTCWAPSPILKYIGRMKRPDVRLAWREKVTLLVLILLLNAFVVFYIVEFGRLLCPNYDKAWNAQEVAYHDSPKAYWVSFRGGVYDLSKFWKLQHSDTNQETTNALMLPFAGTDVSPYLVPPLWLACPGLVSNKLLGLQNNNTLLYPAAKHISGPDQPVPTSKLRNAYWYTQTLLPKMKTMYKGQLVIDRKTVQQQGEDNNHMWVIINNKIYDLTDYFHTLVWANNLPDYAFLGDQVAELIQSNPGMDITDLWTSQLNYTMQNNALNCFNNMFFVGSTDFRQTPKCQVQNYLLLAFTCILGAVILVKFFAALQFGAKLRPSQQDKFVICQVPAYTEGEDSLRKGLDSLTALTYDNKRKLICVICDGMIVGGGNDRPTPKIVLDILGVDPKVDPPALPFKSVGQGSEQLNYGKVYSGLYEYEGNVVPYIVIVKVGKQSEQARAKPGNRGKRDSQILLMSFLNRVHHRAPMNPLELEIFHQINNIIGVDPELYEYLFMVDADTKVKEDSLNRLVAACANDAKVAGICGETSLENEERSWWTMIQVYEYYISHHLAKAFESLFGSVTCLPGCFCMYRLRTADKGRPLIINDKIIAEYADNNIDTLHKKNLLQLGEDRYLTTIMTKHFPSMSFKFVPGASALTEAPSEWSVLLSQRRRWINSTVHNLVELFWLDNMCGFCCFSMRFVVFVDLIGTILLPATCGYLVYLVYKVASHSGAFPLISIVVLAAVYGLQMVIFIVKRQWQHIGWMIIYLLAYPIYSLVLPLYSFWKMDDFSWGSTRIVIGEKGMKKVIATTDEGYDPRSIPLQRWDDYALANGLAGRRGLTAEEKAMYHAPDHQYHDIASGGVGGHGYEMDDMHSVYSSTKPASTVLTGFAGLHQHQNSYYRPPQPSPANPFLSIALHPSQNRQSSFSRYTDAAIPSPANEMHQRIASGSAFSEGYFAPSRHPSREALLAATSPPPLPSHAQKIDRTSRSPYAPGPSRPGSTHDLAAFTTQGPSHESITKAIRDCLGEVDLDRVTKKQLKVLTEQRLQCQLSNEKKVFLDAQIDAELAGMAD